VEPVLRLSNVRYSYPSGVPALNGVDMELRAGEIVAVVGQNGSGKTTLFKVISGLLRPYSGVVTINGTDARSMTVGEIAGVVGLVLQNPDVQLFSQTVLEEVEFGPRHLGMDPRASRGRAEEVLRILRLEGKAAEFPLSLPRGERVRLAVAACLALKPAVLMLDEPTTGQDFHGLREIARIMRSFARSGGAVLLATHNMEIVAENAHRIITMESGAVKVNGPTRWLMSMPGLLTQVGINPPQVVRLDREVLGDQRTALTVEELTDKIEEKMEEKRAGSQGIR
jgi:energy-coupling factor transport system ATP-binding protein